MPSHETEVNSDLITKIAQYYDLENCELVSTHIYWGSHIRWRLHSTNKGDVFIKESPNFLDKTEFLLNINFQIFAQTNKDFLVPILNNVHGLFISQIAGKLIVAYPWINARTIDLSNQEDIVKAAQIYAEFLITSKEWEVQSWKKSWEYPTKRSQFSPDTYKEIYDFTYLIDTALQTMRYEKWKVEYLRKWLLKSSERFAHVGKNSLVQQFNHGDLQPYNFLVDSHNNYFLIDFDRLHWSYRLCDICSLLVIIGANHLENSILRPYYNDQWHCNNMKLFLDEIDKIILLEELERAILSEILGLFCIRNFIFGFDLDEPGIRLPEDFLLQLDKLINLLENIPNLESYSA